MTRLGYLGMVSMILIAATAGCVTDEALATTETSGDIMIAIPASPGDVTAIHVAVTGGDFVGSVDTDLVKQPDQSWLGTILDVPPGPGRTVTAEGFDVVANNTTVFAGKLTSIALTLKPLNDGPFPVVNTPPHFVTLLFPDTILSNETATFFANADDPDANTQLTYTWSVLSGGGSFSTTTIPNQPPGTAVSTVYTPVSGFGGFAVIQVSVTDGIATTTTSFPLAIGSVCIAASSTSRSC
jgi:hypothetical protein